MGLVSMKLTKEQLMAGARSLAAEMYDGASGLIITPPGDTGGWAVKNGWIEVYLSDSKVVIRALVLVALGNDSE